jgi:succinate dehydrogenase membrane anchor subunit
MSYRTPLGRVRGLGSAGDGTHHWWAQRLTALALIPLVIWFVVNVVTMIGADHAAMVGWMSSPISATLMVLLIVATFHHAQLGLQVVIEDYIQNEGWKFGLIIIIKFAAILLGGIAVFSILKLAFGG